MPENMFADQPRSSTGRGMGVFLPFLLAAGMVLGFGGIVLLARYTGPLPLSITQTTTAKQSTFDVQGESKVITIPDKAVVSMGITVNENTVKAAQDKANGIINSVTEELAKLGVEKADIKTENYTLYPQYDYQGTPRIVGYNVNAMLTVSMTDFSKLNQAVEAATRVGANQISGISFTLSDEKREQVEKEARSQAIENAQEKAKQLSGLAGMRLGKIVNVSETPLGDKLMYPMMDAVAMGRGAGGGGGAPTNVEPGSTTYTYTVTLSYETL